MMRRLAVLLVVVVATAAVPAAAHVTVNPDEATKGGFAKLAFRVPNERDAAATVQVEVAFPTEHPLRSVSVRPMPGWTYAVERSGEAVSRITWTGGVIRPGEFEEFEVSGGPLPEDGDRLVFRALQTYDNGEVVRWIDEPVAGGPEPERPAPVLTLVDGEGDATKTVEQPDDDDALLLGIAVTATLALLAAAAALMRGRRP